MCKKNYLIIYAFRLLFNYEVKCKKNFHGKNCTKFCDPMGKLNYQCDEDTGKLICSKGS